MAESSLWPMGATPKRKRDDVILEEHAFSGQSRGLTLPKTTFSFQPPISLPASHPHHERSEDGNSSPRSKVAQKFQELALESGGGVIHGDRADRTVVVGTGAEEANPGCDPGPASPRFSPELPIFDFDGDIDGNRGSHHTEIENMHLDDDDDDGASHKRIRLQDPNPRQDTAATGLNGRAIPIAPKPIQPNEPHHFALQPTAGRTTFKATKSNGHGHSQTPNLPTNRGSASHSRNRRRAGTPPLSKRRTTALSAEEPAIIDPIRAALTWHEDEITVYDPDDKDDDGTGINGIGFKPTPAIAYARAQKRRQQLAEYRKREESEARARRNQRRRGKLGGASELDANHSIVRVRFSDAEPTTAVTI
ncbi:hypothetical protein GGS23DRAFT_509382 [Durotheca rogersii]|uniref:uncharacterized protein n=1 Tax=Durotheca rogersii TaxID=419775 RepID=UPI00221F60B0|nr:uncharacterized protein GGS23DRAFT_509382 [Durotheca rogersii]KAI5863663.1 hypothetical protein GGS23DRAFT_509382 [Durotheca rogersii]